MHNCYKVVIIFAIALMLCLIFLCSCGRCCDCKPQLVPGSAAHPFEVCQNDDESYKDYMDRVKRYRNSGYTCE